MAASWPVAFILSLFFGAILAFFVYRWWTGRNKQIETFNDIELLSQLEHDQEEEDEDDDGYIPMGTEDDTFSDFSLT